MSDATDYIGNVTDNSQRVIISADGASVSKQYRFTFTRSLPTGCKIVGDGGVTYCEITDQVLQGDVITFTSVSNTENGWIYSKTGAGIVSSDGSVNIDWVDGQADLSVSGGGFDPSTLAKVATSGSSEDLVDGGYLFGNSVTKIEDKNGIPSGSSSSSGAVKSLKGKVIVSTNYLSSWINKYTPFIIGKFEALLNAISVRKETLSVDADGKVTGYSATNLEDINEFGESLITSNYFNMWVEKFKPASKGKKIYYITSQEDYHIPQDADIVILKRSDFPQYIESQSMIAFLPQGCEVGKEIIVITSVPSYKDVGLVLPIDIYIKNIDDNMIIARVSSGYYRRFVYCGTTEDLADGWVSL